MQTQFSGSFLYPACITFVKLSILFQYRRVFASHSDGFKWQINFLIVIVTAWGLGIMVTACFLCTPIDKLWNLDPTAPGRCIDIVKFYYGLQIPNILTDVLIIVVPIREVMTLDLTRKLKVGAIAMFLLGAITLSFDIVRLVAMIALKGVVDQTCKSKLTPFAPLPADTCYTDHIVDAALWTTVEPSVAIIAVCIPSVRSLTRARSGNRSTDQWVSDRSDAAITSVQEYVKPIRLPSEDIGTVEMGIMQSRTRPIGDDEKGGGRHDWARVTEISESERPFQRFAQFEER